MSRQGGLHQCSLYAVTFYRVDECEGKLDISPTPSPPGNWKYGGQKLDRPVREAYHCGTAGVPLPKIEVTIDDQYS